MTTTPPVQPMVEAIADAVQAAVPGLAILDTGSVDLIARAAIHVIASRTSAERRAAVSRLINMQRAVSSAQTAKGLVDASKAKDEAEVAVLALLGVPPVPDAEIERLVDELINAAWTHGQRIERLGRQLHDGVATEGGKRIEEQEHEAVKNARTALLTAIQQRRVVVDDAAVERALKAYLEDDFRFVYQKEHHQAIWDGMRAAIEAAVGGAS